MKVDPYDAPLSSFCVPRSVAVLFRLLIALFLFSFSRLFFYIFNLQSFQGLGLEDLALVFLGGLRFDLSALLAFNAPFIIFSHLPFSFRPLYQRVLNALYYIPNTLLLLLNFIDTAYYPFSLKRLTAEFAKTAAFSKDAWAPFFFYVMDYWYLFALVFVHTGALLYFSGKVRLRPLRFSVLRRLGSLAVLALWIGLLVLGIRGGFQSRPLSISSAGLYAKTSRDIPLVLNTPFSLLNTLNAKALQKQSYFEDDSEMLAIFNARHCFPQKGPFRPLNVVILILESFGAEYVGALNKDLPPPYQGYTPFLDSLIEQSLVLDAYANGSISLESVSSIFASIPSLMPDAYFVSAYAGNALQALPAILEPYGYTTAFFHGGRNGTMGFDRFAKIAGFQRYYGKDEYGNDADYDGVWGIYDGPFLNFFADTLKGFKEPFLASLFTLSSHHPYTLPPHLKGHYPKGPLGIHESIGYVDDCLKVFFEKVSQLPWYDNTLFVITADHTSSVYHPQYNLKAGRPRIPIIYYHPGSNLKGYKADYTQQIDIMPSVLGYLNYDKPFVSFGESVLESQGQHFAVFHRNGNYILRKDGYWLVFDGEKSLELYDTKADFYLNHNLIGQNLPLQKDMEAFLKALLQQYQQRLIENKLLP